VDLLDFRVGLAAIRAEFPAVSALLASPPGKLGEYAAGIAEPAAYIVLRLHRLPRFPDCSIHAGPDVNDPAQRPQADKPKHPGPNKKHEGPKNSPLDQLSQAGEKETAKRSDHVSSRSASRIHDRLFLRVTPPGASDSREFQFPVVPSQRKFSSRILLIRAAASSLRGPPAAAIIS